MQRNHKLRSSVRILRFEKLERREVMDGDLSSPVVDNLIPQGAINGLYDNNFLLAGDFDHNGYADLLYINAQSGANESILARAA